MTVEELITELETYDPGRLVELAVGSDGTIHTGEAVRVDLFHHGLVLITTEP